MIGLGEFDLLVNNGRNYINTWNSVDLEKHSDKLKMQALIAKDYPALKSELVKLSNNWPWEDMRNELKVCLKQMDSIIVLDQKVMSMLNNFDAYSDFMVKFETGSILEEIDPKSIALSTQISELKKLLKKQTDNAEAGMISGFDTLMSQTLIFALIVIVLGIGMGVLLSTVIVNPVNQLRGLINRLSQGELPDLKINTLKDEIGDMVISMEDYIKELRKTSAFASEVGKGNFEEEYSALSEKDVLGNALVEMRDNLKTAREAREKQLEEEKFKQWYVTGVAKFAEILRDSDSGLQAMMSKFIKELATYTNVQQGTIYTQVINKEEKYLELMASYGCDSKLLELTRLDIGEGLAGQAFKDSKETVLPVIPENFVHNYKVLSGLGETIPTSLVILPIKNDEKTVGVVELSSYQTIDSKTVEFLKDVLGSLASIVVNAQLNEQTQRLLNETKDQSVKIQQSEEDMRQNMEELRAVQEQLEIRSQELQNEVESYKAKFGELNG